MLTAVLYAILTFNVRNYIMKVQNTRIRKTHGDEETTFVYNTNARLSQLLVEKKGDTITKYVYGHGLICSYTNDEVNSMAVYHHDYRGSTTAITNILAGTTDTFDYDIYGKLISKTGTTETPFMYNGRDGVYSDENGLIYMRARYYSPELRRFVNADILHGSISDSTSLNRYAYVNGNPVSFVDPLGLSSEHGGGKSNPFNEIYDKQKLINELIKHYGNKGNGTYYFGSKGDCIITSGPQRPTEIPIDILNQILAERKENPDFFFYSDDYSTHCFIEEDEAGNIIYVFERYSEVLVTASYLRTEYYFEVNEASYWQNQPDYEMIVFEDNFFGKTINTIASFNVGVQGLPIYVDFGLNLAEVMSVC